MMPTGRGTDPYVNGDDMTDYQKLAAEAKAAHVKRQAEETAKREESRRARAAYVDRAASVLETSVLPKLKEAVAAFEREGIDSRITTLFDVKDYTDRNPSVKFQCLGPKRASDGWQFESPPIFFSSNGKSVMVGISKHNFSRDADEWTGTAPAENCGDLIDEGIKKAIAEYYSALESNRYALRT
jgi:hypothetical protein